MVDFNDLSKEQMVKLAGARSLEDIRTLAQEEVRGVGGVIAESHV